MDNDDRSERVREAFEGSRPHRYQEHIRQRIDRVVEILDGHRPASVLDVGCGTGEVSIHFAEHGAALTQVDVSHAMVETARRHAGSSADVRVLEGDVLELLEGETFELILCLGVLAHVGDVEATVRRLAELTNPGGRAIVQMTDASTVAGTFEHVLATRGNRRRGYRLNRVGRTR